MEFSQTVYGRRMMRRFDPDRLVSRETSSALLNLAVRAPSAGFSQGWHFLVLDAPEDVGRYWNLTAPAGPADTWLLGMSTAPLLILGWADPNRYRDRYARADKAGSTASTTGAASIEDDLAHWPVAWWDADTAMASLLILLGAVDRGLGACLFGVPPARWDDVRAAFGVPTTLRPVTALAIGYPPDDPAWASRRTNRVRRATHEVVSYGRFGSA